MNHAAKTELPPAQKAPHAVVAYEHPSAHEGHRCGNCANFIRAAGEKPRCRTVQNPIRAEDWCLRYKEKQ